MSTGTVGDSYDNALAENVNGSYKNELIHTKTWADVVDVEIATFEWVTGWNESRVHQSLGYRTPTEVETEFWEPDPNHEIIEHKANAQEQNPGHFSFAVIGGLFAPWIMLAATVFIGVTNAPLGAVLGTVMIEAIPDELRGRVMGTQNACMLTMPSLAAMTFAGVANAQGLAWAGVALIVVVVVVGVLALASSTLRTLEIAA